MECNDSIERIRSWGNDVRDGITQVQATANHEKNLLLLCMETHPLPFQPSPVLMQLIKNNRRRGNPSVLVPSAKQRKQQSADYLDRKFESEIRQHYELENAENCARWKQFHVHVAESRRQIAARLKRDCRNFCRQLGIPADVDLEHKKVQHQQLQDIDNQNHEEASAETTTNNQPSLSIEDTLRLHLAQNWVHHERFNIQEAFTNQTKMVQEDMGTFLAQQEAEFLEERQKLLSTSAQADSQTETVPVLAQYRRQQNKSQFQSNTKRSMLIHTAPPLVVDPTGDERLVQWQTTRSRSRRFRGDSMKVQRKLDELQRRWQIREYAAEVKREDAMQWIGRQCAHMFAQLDCKDTEAKVVALLLDEELSQTSALHHRVSEIVNILVHQVIKSPASQVPAQKRDCRKCQKDPSTANK